jgi:hypothetical protein
LDTRRYSSKQEKYVAKKFNGKVQPNSGATPFLKGDVVIGSDWLVECKTHTTSKKSITIKKDWLDKLEEERFAMRKTNSVLAFNFGPDEQMYYVVTEKVFKEIVRRTQNE